jgi:hypothetical protein
MDIPPEIAAFGSGTNPAARAESADTLFSKRRALRSRHEALYLPRQRAGLGLTVVRLISAEWRGVTEFFRGLGGAR